MKACTNLSTADKGHRFVDVTDEQKNKQPEPLVRAAWSRTL